MEEHLRLLISAKAVICHDRALVLAKNLRGEWDLPGGKLQSGESIEEALNRELNEELSVNLVSSTLLSAERHHYYADILVLVYGCEVEGADTLVSSGEHSEVGAFPFERLPTEAIPAPYIRPIQSWISVRET